MSHRILGIYLEDSMTYIGSLVEAENGGWYPQIDSDSFIDTHFSNSINGMDLTVEDIIRKALDQGSSLHRDVPIRRVSVAAPGPMKNCGSNMIDSVEYGLINRYSKERERFNGVNLKATLKKSLEEIGMPSDDANIAINHDAAAHAFGEYHSRRSENQRPDDWTHIHVIVNDGIGGAIINKGIIAQGRMHSELGHVHVLRHPIDRESNIFRCEAHEWQDCLEGMVGLAALKKRWGEPAIARIAHWPEDDPRLSVIASYFAQLCTILTLIVAPRHIVFSGAPFKNPFLAGSIRRLTRAFSARTGTGDDSLYPGYQEQSADDFIESCAIPEAAALGTCLLGTEYHRRKLKVEKMGKRQ